MPTLVVLAAVATVLIAPGSAAAQSWIPQKAPAKQGFNGRSAGVSCATSTACMAVGFFVNPQGRQRALAQVWNGSAWAGKAVPVPAGATRSRLVAVSCTAANACTAVGSYSTATEEHLPLIVRWDGTAWMRQALTLPAGTRQAYLNDVSCTLSYGCKAVGAYGTADVASASLAAHWNGTAWAVRASPNPAGAARSGLNGISCTGAICIAVGDAVSPGSGDLPNQTFAARFGGSAWSLRSLPAPAGASAASLKDVSCSAATACTAVGGYATAGSTPDTPLVARWNGTSWTRQDTPAKPSLVLRRTLEGVSCSAASSCTAVGGDMGGVEGPVVLRWNGTSWQAQTAPRPAGMFSAWLAGVSCNSGACTAVGGASQWGESAAESVTLAERQAAGSTAWTVQATPNATGTLRTELFSASCTSATSCTAVGPYFAPREAGAAIVRWNGTGWAHMTPGARLGTGRNGDNLRDVSCTAAGACMAVGFYLQPGTFASRPEAQRYDGTRWTSAKLPVPAAATATTGVELHAVSCASATACVAVGDYGDFSRKALAEHWNGTTWTIKPLPEVASGASLKGVSCSAGGACIAVGSASGGPLVLRWNGSAWSKHSPPVPDGTYQADLADVSCTAANACTAVGAYFSGGGSGSLIERWNGTSWTLQSAPYGGLTDVSCSSLTSCMGVGPNGISQGWDGTSWDYAGSLIGQFSNGVSCSGASACTTVGSAFSWELVSKTVFAGVHVVHLTNVPSALRYSGAEPGAADSAPKRAGEPAAPRALGAEVVRTGS